MRRLRVFNQISLDGYFSGPGGDFSWAHKTDAEWQAFVSGNAGGDSVLLFGRVTYELMAGYWPTPMARANDPAVAERMCALPKVVFSRTLAEPSWENTTVLRGDLATEVRALKQSPGPDLVILGSGSIVAQLAAAALIDEYQIVVNPLALGSGRTLFAGLPRPVQLQLKSTRAFRNGNVLLTYDATT